MRRRDLLAAMLLGTLAPSGARGQGGLAVVATFSILGDMVREIGGQRVAVSVLVGPDGDAHVYQPSPADARLLAGAAVLVINGLGFEGWIERLVSASGFAGRRVVATAGLAPRKAEDEHGHGHAHGGGSARHQRGVTRPPAAAPDPHAWQDLANARLYVRNIAAALAAADPAGRAAYEAGASAYLARIDALDREVRSRFAAIPAERRRVITSHDAFGYFGAAYGVEFIAASGISTEAEPSAGDVGRIIRQMRQTGVRTVFIENMTDGRLVEQIAREAGGVVGGTLYADALSPPGGPADSYLKMFEYNVRALIAGMTGG